MTVRLRASGSTSSPPLRRLGAGLVAGAAVVALAGCGGGDSSASASTTSSSSESGSASSSTSMEGMGMTDAMFAAMMIPHHQDGVKLAQMGVQMGSSQGVRDLAQQMLDEQQSQIPTLQQIAESGGQSEMPPEDPLQTFNDEQMSRLQSLTGADFDRMWLDTFRSHHMAAIMMADIALAGTAGGDAKTLEQKIHDGQLQQVDTMNQLRQQLG